MNLAIDLDGTIITCKERHVALLVSLARAHGLSVDGDMVWSYKRRGFSNHRVLHELNISSKKIDAICRQWEELIETYPWLDFDRPIFGAKRCLTAWRSQGWTLHLVSARKNKVHGNMQLQRLGIAGLFSTINFVCPREQNNKATVLHNLAADFYIGDTERDWREAVSANVTPILVSSGMRTREFLSKSTHVPVYSSLADIEIGEDNERS